MFFIIMSKKGFITQYNESAFPEMSDLSQLYLLLTKTPFPDYIISFQ